MDIYYILIIIISLFLLIHSYFRNQAILVEKEQLIKAKDAALDISTKVLDINTSFDLYQYILEACLKLIPKAKFGSILMFDEDGLLVAKASIGFNSDEISNFKLPLEEAFLYTASKGKLDKTIIINRLDDLVLEKYIVQPKEKGAVLKSEVSSPLYINNELVGMLCIDGDENDIFSDQDIYVLDYISSQISTVINNQKLYGEVLHLSRYDGLTNLLNRNSFDSEVALLLDDPSIDAKNRFFVLIDLDELKAANDTYGHHFGDEMIINFSAILKNQLDKRDLCGRYGGDEFAAIFQGDYYEVRNTLENIRKQYISSHKPDKENRFSPDFSYGLASFQEGSCDLDALYKLADTRMYEVKNKKKNGHHLS